MYTGSKGAELIDVFPSWGVNHSDSAGNLGKWSLIDSKIWFRSRQKSKHLVSSLILVDSAGQKCVFLVELHVLGGIWHAYPILSPHLGRNSAAIAVASAPVWLYHGRRGRSGARGARGAACGKAALRGCQLEPLLEWLSGWFGREDRQILSGSKRKCENQVALQ